MSMFELIDRGEVEGHVFILIVTGGKIAKIPSHFIERVTHKTAISIPNEFIEYTAGRRERSKQ